MNAKHRRTLEMLYAKPSRSDVPWADIERLVEALGGAVSEGAGSRVRFLLNDIRATFHRPHPKREASKAQVDSVRDFLKAARVKP